MKLFEILDSAGKKGDLKDAVERLAKAHGRELFSGQQAYVIPSKNGKYVYRVWSRDAGYEKWLKEALKMQDNPHVMKVLGKLRVIENVTYGGKQGDVKVLKLERLKPVTDSNFEDALELLTAVKFSTTLDDIKKMDAKSFLELALTPENAAKFYIDEIKPGPAKFLTNNKSFVATYLKLLQLGYNDLTPDNIMARGDIPVFVDPYGMDEEMWGDYDDDGDW